MNRKERRNKGLIKRSEPVYYMTQSQIDSMKRECVDTGVKQGWDVCALFALFALRDNYGFGQKRINDFMDAMEKKLQLYNEGCFDLRDLQDTLRDEVGIDIKLTGITESHRGKAQ